MKRKFLLIVTIVVTALGCNKENTETNSLTTGVNETSMTQRTDKFNVVHNGNTLNVNENAVSAHLQHGDRFGSVEDNVLFQSVLVSETPLSINDPLYIDFRNSIGFTGYNESKFGELDLNNALLGMYLNGEKVIYIPSKDKKETGKKGLAGFVPSNNLTFFSIVVETKLIIESIENVDQLIFETSSGSFSFFEPSGQLLVTTNIKSNSITDIIIGDGGTVESSCFANCYKQARSDCSTHFGCEIACALMGEIPCILGTAMCCGASCGLTGSGSSCLNA